MRNLTHPNKSRNPLLPDGVEEFKHITVYRTKNYDMFKLIKGNRKINRGEILNFARSIKKINLLHENPIQVTTKMEVKDGQRRLATAKYLHEYIYFVVIKQAPLPEIQSINSNVRKWTYLHFLESHIEMGNKDYIFFKKLLEKYNFTFSATLVMILHPDTLRRNRDDTRKFREGELVAEDRERTEEVFEVCADILQFAHEPVKQSHRFFDAVFYMITKQPAYVNRLLMKLAETGKKQIYRAATKREYIEQFQSILNKGVYYKRIDLF